MMEFDDYFTTFQHFSKSRLILRYPYASCAILDLYNSARICTRPIRPSLTPPNRAFHDDFADLVALGVALEPRERYHVRRLLIAPLLPEGAVRVHEPRESDGRGEPRLGGFL